jgi:hypothetical protein
MKRRIRLTLWGNWNGYLGSRKVIEFGTDRRGAEEWLGDPAKFEQSQREAREASMARKCEKPC